MKVSLNQVEIEKVLKEHLSNNGISIANSDIQYSFTNGRKNKGISVEITIEKNVGNSTDKVIPTGPIPRTCISVDEPENEDNTPIPRTDILRGPIEMKNMPIVINPDTESTTSITGMFD